MCIREIASFLHGNNYIKDGIKFKIAYAMNMRLFISILSLLFGCFTLIEAVELPQSLVSNPIHKVYSVTIEGQITSAHLYIVRRAIKEAIQTQTDVLVLKLNTPGGSLETTLDIIRMLEKYEGQLIAYVDPEAISAGAYITMTADKIYFTPKGIIGAAAVIQSDGKSLDPTLRKKLESYLKARIRQITEGRPYRFELLSAMMDENSVCEIEESQLKASGELLSLTAQQAVALIGPSNQPLLANGIATNITDLLDQALGRNSYTLESFEMTIFEHLAQYLQLVAPFLLGSGLLLLFIELKTPGFGWIGGLGVSMLVIVFLGHYIAGLAGYEPFILLGVALILLIFEFIVFPGTLIPGILGMLCIIMALVWNMSDVWPTYSGKLEWQWSGLTAPLWNTVGSLAIALGGALALKRFLPKFALWNQLVLNTRVDYKEDMLLAAASSDFIGYQAIVLTDLRPVGYIKLDGKQYEARIESGMLSKGSTCQIVGFENRQWIVTNIEKALDFI